MVISFENEYIFIATPKTGSRSIRKFLLQIDPSALYHKTLLEQKKINLADHSSAQEINKVLGPEFKQFKVFAFVRHPYSKMVSSYFFYRSGYALTKNNKKKLATNIRIWFARFLPFKIWALLYPYSGNMKYLVDEKGKLIVDYVGRQEFLSEDLKNILSKIGLNKKGVEIPFTNKSSKSTKDHFSNNIFKKLINLKLNKDIRFYNEVVNITENQHS